MNLYHPDCQWTCKRCDEPMGHGKAIVSTSVGQPDFAADGEVVTVSPGGPGRLVDCLKCPQCGLSVWWSDATSPSQD